MISFKHTLKLLKGDYAHDDKLFKQFELGWSKLAKKQHQS